MNVRLTSELRAKLQALADAEGRTLSAYISRVLEAHADAAADKAAAAPKGPARSDKK